MLFVWWSSYEKMRTGRWMFYFFLTIKIQNSRRKSPNPTHYHACLKNRKRTCQLLNRFEFKRIHYHFLTSKKKSSLLEYVSLVVEQSFASQTVAWPSLGNNLELDIIEKGLFPQKKWHCTNFNLRLEFNVTTAPSDLKYFLFTLSEVRFPSEEK